MDMQPDTTALSFYDLPEQNLTTLIQRSNDHPDKIKLIDFINSLASYELSHPALQLFLTQFIHLCAKYQQDNLFWLTFTICQNSPKFNISQQLNKLGDYVIHTLMRSPHSPHLLEGLLSHLPLLEQLNHFQETSLHVFLSTLAFNQTLREKLLTGELSLLSVFLEILTRVYLLENKQTSNIFIYNKPGYSPLHLCAFYGLDIELDILLTLFPDSVDYPTAKKNTCLLIAAKQGHLNIINTLIKHQANLFISTSKKQNTALHIAAKKGNRLICELLLQAGLTLTKNKFNFTPLDIAKQNHHHDTYKLLLKHENTQIISNFTKNFTPLYSQSILEKPELTYQELTLNTFLMGISLGYELAYQKTPEGTLVTIKNEFNQPQLYSVHPLYNTAGLISHVYLPYDLNSNHLAEIYVTFQGTADTDALHRDLETKGPGYHSYKEKETNLITRFFKILDPLLNSHANKISITLAGHSLGGGDSFYFLQSLLKVIAKQLPSPTSDPLQLEKLISDKSLNASDDISGIINETENLLLQKPLIAYNGTIIKINKLRIIALNPVGLPKSIDYGIEGLTRYIHAHGPQGFDKIKIDSFVLRSAGDFAQRMSDRIPLCDILPEYAHVHLLLAPGDNFSLHKGSACYLGSVGINPRGTATSLLNVGTDMAIMGTLAGLTLGPFGILLGLAVGGVRLYASEQLSNWGRHIVRAPHTNLLPITSGQTNLIELLEKIKLISNTHPEDLMLIKEIGHNLGSTDFEHFVTRIIKKKVAEKLNNALI